MDNCVDKRYRGKLNDSEDISYQFEVAKSAKNIVLLNGVKCLKLAIGDNMFGQKRRRLIIDVIYFVMYIYYL